MTPHVQQTPPYTREPSPKQDVSTTQSRPLANTSLLSWKKLGTLLQGKQCIIDGNTLDIAGVIAVAKYGMPAFISTDDVTRKRIDDSVHMLKRHLDSGHLVYGVSTGFGGSADTRTDNLEDLQRALIQHQNSGILTGHDIGRPIAASAKSNMVHIRDVDYEFSTNSMPTSWIEAAANIFSFLSESALAKCVGSPKDTKMTGLYQDRYGLRTSTQWIGPQIEDLLHATSQIEIELNSTTDNPLIDVESDHILHGGNFQAAIVTSTMDRARLCLERLGKMMFSQATEIINPMLNSGLPANLSADDPSLSFTCKGIDINIASYQSELGFLANPVGSHVQSAEMHNQAINSLALISSRYTFQALDTIYMLAASHLFVLCQALDLRVLQNQFLDSVEPKIESLIETLLDTNMQTCKELQAKMQDLYETKRQELFQNHLTVTPSYLGSAARRMYRFVRGDLGIKFNRGLVEHPTQPLPPTVDVKEPRKTIGSQISVIYEALTDGRGTKIIMACAEEGLRQEQTKV
ncbi:phenylalanine ammonia-lyase [Aureobasidium subglaciale]|nr:phenylalanine ammonia-lyase [Aureobasidium subglaciale]